LASNITDNSKDLWLLSDECTFPTLSIAVAPRLMHPSRDAYTRLIPASLDKQVQSQDRAFCLLGETIGWLQRAAVEDERVKVTKAAKNIDPAGSSGGAWRSRYAHLRVRLQVYGGRAKLKGDLVSVQRPAKDRQ
jgi:hypothetical protein